MPQLANGKTTAVPGVALLGSRLAAFEELLRGTGSLTELAASTPPDELPLLFHVALGTFLRRGPGADGAEMPARLLALAQRAVGEALLTVETPILLRRTLAEMEVQLQRAGAWDAARPPWWAPLPEPTVHESVWEGLDRCDRPDALLALPRPADLRAAFGDGGPLRLPLPAFLAPALLVTISRELDALVRDGRLPLAREGVGAAGTISARRSDEVVYLDGREADLLAASPTLQTFVQWGLRRLADVLAAGTGRRIHPPQRAMLARYPAPSGGYAPHLDNPGGEHENGRDLSLVVYPNAPGQTCRGGELALWPAGGSTADEPSERVVPRGGDAVLFDARAVAHQVCPLESGPARWSLTFWFHDSPTTAPTLVLPRRPSLTEALLPIEAPPLAADRALFHELSDGQTRGQIVVRSTRSYRSRPRRVGIVATVYRGGPKLDAWCAHHLDLGFDHLALVFDHLEEPAEAADAERLRAAWPAERLTVWAGSEVAARWHGLPKNRDWDDLLHYAPEGSSSYAIASRQTLNACVALEAARGDELGGARLDWLVHLDVDELFYLEGEGRGGATLQGHLAALEGAGLKLVRYVNHELMLPWPAGEGPRFKRNPRLAAARLGTRGFASLVAHLGMAQTDPRPYFNGYLNGKSAVAVSAATAAAGVHGFALSGSSTPAMQSFLAGPSILHFHFTTPATFRDKYRRIAASPPPAGPRLFRPSPTEEAALALLHELEREAADEATVVRRLDELHARLTTFSTADVELLEEAGLLLRPRLAHPLPVA